MTETITRDGVRLPDLSVRPIPDFTGRWSIDDLYIFCFMLDVVLSDNNQNRIRIQEGEEGLKNVPVYSIDIQDPKTGEIRKGRYTVDLTSLRQEEEGPEVIYLKNERLAMYRLRDEWCEAMYNLSLGSEAKEKRIKNCGERFRRELFRLPQ